MSGRALNSSPPRIPRHSRPQRLDNLTYKAVLSLSASPCPHRHRPTGPAEFLVLEDCTGHSPVPSPRSLATQRPETPPKCNSPSPAPNLSSSFSRTYRIWTPPACRPTPAPATHRPKPHARDQIASNSTGALSPTSICTCYPLESPGKPWYMETMCSHPLAPGRELLGGRPGLHGFCFPWELGACGRSGKSLGQRWFGFCFKDGEGKLDWEQHPLEGRGSARKSPQAEGREIPNNEACLKPRPVQYQRIRLQGPR